MLPEPDLATVASLIGDPSRASILSALMSGEALPASELAYRAQITPQTTSSHLTKLLEGGLIKVNKVGRHRYYSLKNHDVAQMLEVLQRIAPISKATPIRNRHISPELCFARTCYDHLAGKLGVAVTQVLIEQEYLIQDEEIYTVTSKGEDLLNRWEIDVQSLQKQRRKFAFPCVDWSERNFHIAGSLGAAIAEYFFQSKWVKRIPHTRALAVTTLGDETIDRQFGLRLTSISHE